MVLDTHNNEMFPRYKEVTAFLVKIPSELLLENANQTSVPECSRTTMIYFDTRQVQYSNKFIDRGKRFSTILGENLLTK